MKLKEFIQNQILLPRLKKSGVLAVYDPEHLYHELCLDMSTENLRVIDASESSIESREEALKALRSLGTPKELDGMLVYVPAKVPLTDEEKQVDPFSLYSACGDVFPDSAGDEYMHLCLKAKPDHGTEIRRIFNENPLPDFAVIDALGGGFGWPNLQVILGVESASDILFAILAPSERQKDLLKENETWVSEAKELFQTCIGLKLITRGKTWSSIGDELWRFLLFSEFIFDLPASLPDSLSNVPRAPEEAKHLIEDLCDRLRNDRRTQSIYIDRAETIEEDLDLPGHCKSLKDLGARDTFPFEERSFLTQAVDALNRDETDIVRSILGRHKHSVWVGKGESQAQWGLIRSALALYESCDDYARQLPDHSSSFDDMIDFYIGRFREVDRLQREFEQSIADLIDADTLMDSIVEKARDNYRRVSAKVHDLFIRHLETNGWPPLGRLANADVFDTLIAPKLQESGRKVAYLLIDALRYELGVALEKQLSEDDSVELSPAFAQLPTITTVGMASLLPEAGNPNIIFFCDRPVRTAGHMTREAFMKLVTEGGDSFVENPPNAAISIFGAKNDVTEIIVTLYARPVVNGDDMVFPVKVLGDRFTPLELWGPSGQKPELGLNSVIEGLKQFTKWHTVSFETCVPVDRAYEIETHELDYRKNPGIAYQKNGVTIKHWPALHIIDGAISYRLDWNGMSFVWSGDTNPNHFFVDNAKGADIILHETAPIAARFAQAANVPKKIADNIIAASHTPAKAYGKVLSLTKPNLAVTNHCPIDAQEITEIVKDISVHWKGPYQVGQDFMVFNISKGKKEILVRQAAVNERSWSPNVEKAKGKIPLNPTDYRSNAIFGKEIKDY